MTSRTVWLRADGGYDLGFGHIKRCLSLAAELAQAGVTCKFACRRGSDRAAAQIRDHGYAVVYLPERGGLWGELTALNDDKLFSGDAMVLDISHRDTSREASAIPKYFAGLRQRFPAVVMIDSLMHECLAAGFDLPVDLVVLPYAGADGQAVVSETPQYARGTDYFVLDPAFAAASTVAHRPPKTADRLLVTAGGSDPAGITTMTMNALDRLEEHPLEVRIIIGPGYTNDTAVAAADWAANSRHSVTIVRQPETLAGHMAWCHMAVSASGLTKYELAATGTPAILLSINKHHAALNQSFDPCGAATHLGQVKHVTAAALAKSIASLRGDRGARSAMSSAGRAMIDGRGAARLATMIIATIDAAATRSRDINVSEATG